LNIQSDSGFGFSEDYIIHRLVFVNSGASAYVEMPMDRTAALFGKNNEGKTSSLSALKLFVLPEQTLKACERKFGFASQKREYTGLESYNYYFPDEQSYIICEAENRKGVFCMLLKRSREELGYERYGIPVAYNAIRHLFWNFDSPANEGFGESRLELRPPEMVAELKKYGAVLITGVKTIRDAIYARPAHIDDLSRYCLVPLSDRGEKGSAEALSALLGLAFDIRGGSRESLPRAVATIIAGENSGKDMSLDIDVGHIISEAESLKAQAKYLATVRNHLRQWNEVKEHYRRYLRARRVVREEAPPVRASVQLLRDNAEKSLAAISQELQKAKTKADDLSAQYKRTKEEVRNHTADQNSCTRDLTAIQKRLDRISNVEAEAKTACVDGEEAILSWLNAALDEYKEDHKALSDEESGKARLTELYASREKLSRQIAGLKEQLSGDKPRLLSSLSGVACNHLYSLNRNLAMVRLVPTDEQKETVEAFAALLSSNPDTHELTLLGERVPGTEKRAYNPQAELQNWEADLKRVEDEFTDVDRQYRDLDRHLKHAKSSTFRQEKLKQLATDIAKTEEDIKLIKGKGQTLSDAELKQEQLKSTNLALEAANASLSELQDAHAEARLLQSHLEGKSEAQQQVLSRLSGVAGQLEMALASQPDFADLPQADKDLQPLDIDALEAGVASATEAIKDYPLSKNELTGGLAVLSRAGILTQAADLAYRPLSLDEIDRIYEALSAEFSNLNGREGKLKNDIFDHNNENGAKAERLVQIASTIKAFQDQVNEELSNCRISNLSNINIAIDVDERFSSLVRDLQDERFQGTELKSDAFYARLSSFADDFFTGTGRKIQLAQVVTSIHFSFEKQGQRTSAEQSNGTTCMLNIALLSILLKRLVPRNVGLAFPIVFDEVGSIDEANLPAIKAMIEDHGFVLFVANPYKNGVICSLIDDWYDLSLHRAREGKIVRQCRVIHYAMREGITRLTAAPGTEA